MTVETVQRRCQSVVIHQPKAHAENPDSTCGVTGLRTPPVVLHLHRRVQASELQTRLMAAVRKRGFLYGAVWQICVYTGD